MPDSNISVTTVGQVAVLNGTVASPQDAAQAQSIVTSLLNPGKKEGDPLDILPINRLRTATPLQVNLKVKIAEVNRSLLKQIGVNSVFAGYATNGFQFGIQPGLALFRRAAISTSPAWSAPLWAPAASCSASISSGRSTWPRRMVSSRRWPSRT